MNVLVVDDQIDVVNGICKGVDWNSIGVKEVLRAYDARGAKEMIRTGKVDVMLCDIEMPGENGLELFRWVQDQHTSVKCIFLTAHADFDYAQTAVSLGGFDYILQPAPYQEIEKCLIRAIAKLEEERDIRKYSSYGKIFYEEREAMVDHLVCGWFSEPEQGQYAKKLEEALGNLGIDIRQEDGVILLFLQVFGWKKGSWEDSLVRYAVKNILEELFFLYEKKVFLNIIPDYGYLMFCYGGQSIGERELKEVLGRFWDVSNSFFAWRAALYVREQSRMTQFDRDFELFRGYLENNVAQQEKIFYLDEIQDKKRYQEMAEPDYDAWGQLLTQGCGKRVYGEAIEYLDSVTEITSDSATLLRRFYDNFIKMLYLAEAKAKFSHEEIVGEQQELFIHAYETVDAMKRLVHLVTVFFSMEEESSNAVKKQVERIREYIYQNLDKDLRREEIAMEFFINPNYLSRMFKKEMGVSLKEFIVSEKMKMAKMLLGSSSLPVSIVALKVGYTNFSHFSQVYRKYYGVSPTEEKKNGEKKGVIFNNL